MDRRTFLHWLSLSGGLSKFSLANTTELPLAEKPKPQFAPSATSELDEGGTKISLIACGGAGIAMARHVNKAAYGLHEIIAIDTSRRSLQSAMNADRTLLIETDDGKKPQSANEAWHWANERREAISTTIGLPHMAIIFTGLGGSAGTGIASYVSMQARNKGVFAVALATQPFAFEDAVRQMNSEGGFDALASFCNTCALPLETIADQINPEASFNTALKHVRKTVHHFLWNTSACLTRQGMVGIDFEDVRTVLAPGEWGTHSSSSIGWGEGAGKNRAMLASLEAVNHPTLRAGGNEPPYGVSVSIRGEKQSVKMKEINTVMNIIKEQVCGKDTHVIFSGDYDASMRDRMQVSVILHRQRTGPTSS